MQISNKVGYLIIAIVVIVLVGYFWMRERKKYEIPPGAQLGQPGRGSQEGGMMGRGNVEEVLGDEGGFILYLPK